MIEDDNYYVTSQQETTRRLSGGTYQDGWWIGYHDNATNADGKVWVPHDEYPASVATAIKEHLANIRYVANLGTPRQPQ